MSKISKDKKEKIKLEILRFLFDNSPKSMYTNAIADYVLRDEEFTLNLLKELETNKLVMRITKNDDGKVLLARKRWSLPSNIYDAFKKKI